MKKILILTILTIRLFAIEDCKKITILSGEWVDIETVYRGTTTLNKWSIHLKEKNNYRAIAYPKNANYLAECEPSKKQFKILKEWQTK